MCRIAISTLMSLLILAGGVCAVPFDCPMTDMAMDDGEHVGCHQGPAQVLKACCCEDELIGQAAPSVASVRNLDPPMPTSELSPLTIAMGREAAVLVAVSPPPPDSKRFSRLSILLI